MCAGVVAAFSGHWLGAIGAVLTSSHVIRHIGGRMVTGTAETLKYRQDLTYQGRPWLVIDIVIGGEIITRIVETPTYKQAKNIIVNHMSFQPGKHFYLGKYGVFVPKMPWDFNFEK